MKSFAEEMAFYTAYHQERRNVLIHVVGVPLITFSLLALLSLWNVFTVGGVNITAGMIFLAGTLLYYFTLDFIFALVATVFYGALLVAAHQLAGMGVEYAVGAFITGQLTGWSTQIYGHVAYEGNRPALMNNLFQALFSGPIFVIADVFFHLGLRKDLEKELKQILSSRGRLREENLKASQAA